MEQGPILVYGRRPFAVYKSIMDQGCLIDECLVIKLNMKICRIEYSKFTLPDGRIARCVGNASATCQIVDDHGKTSKSVPFKAKIIRDLGCDSIGDVFFSRNAIL